MTPPLTLRDQAFAEILGALHPKRLPEEGGAATLAPGRGVLP
jgi:hypothetical protein